MPMTTNRQKTNVCSSANGHGAVNAILKGNDASYACAGGSRGIAGVPHRCCTSPATQLLGLRRTYSGFGSPAASLPNTAYLDTIGAHFLARRFSSLAVYI